MGNFTASLHTHVRSLFDAHIEPAALCERIKEMGGKGCVITDHGVLSSIEDYRPVFRANDLKMIPGVELYVDGGILGRLHLVLIAVNDDGYHTICKIVTESNKNLHDGFPVATIDMIRQFMKGQIGNVIALSGCMQGVISAIFLQNNTVADQIHDVKKKQANYLSPADKQYFDAQEAQEKAEAEVNELIKQRDLLKACSEQRFAKRESAVSKLEAKGDPSAQKERELLESDKKKAVEAAGKLDSVKEQLDQAKKILTKANKLLKDAETSVEKYLEREEEIEELNKSIKPDAELKKQAAEEIDKYIEIFGKDNFFAEIQYHEIPDEAKCFPKVAELAKEKNVALVATNDVHILKNTKDEILRRQVLKSLRFKDDFQKEQKSDTELYLKDDAELYTALTKIFDAKTAKEAIDNIAIIFDRCDVKFETEKHYPKFSNTENIEEVFDREIAKGIKWRYPAGMDQEHKDRLEYETKIIKSMGYMDYHLVVKDFLEYGRLLGFVPDDKLSEAPLTIDELKDYIQANGWKNGGLTIGPGRGSAVGSLVCYLLGITNLDPIKYDLLFERFLNPERVSMPKQYWAFSVNPITQGCIA